MRFLLLSHAVWSVCGAAIIFWFVGLNAAYAFSFGALLMLLNLSIHVIAWPRILVKKQVALSIGVIVFKFAILGWIIYEVANGKFSFSSFQSHFGPHTDQTVSQEPIDLGWFGAGLSIVVLSVLTTGLSVSLKSARLTKQKT